jgi:hypothetical protein
VIKRNIKEISEGDKGKEEQKNSGEGTDFV